MTGTGEEEFWDIYTKDREKTGRLHRRGDEMKEENFILLSMSVFLTAETSC